MGKIGTGLALLLTLIIAMSCVGLLMVKPTNAQTPPAPSVPTFTIQVINEKGTIPTTYMLNTTSGQVVVDQLGYNYEGTNINVVITNQPFASQYNGTSATGYNSFYYNIRIMEPSWNNWTELGSIYTGYIQPQGGEYSNFTIVSFSNPYENPENYENYENVPLEVQVDAMIGFINVGSVYFPTVFSGQTSDWSATQTVTTSYYKNYLEAANSPTSSPTPTAFTSTTSTTTPTSTANSGFSYASFLLATLIVIAILLAVIVVLLFIMRKQKMRTG